MADPELNRPDRLQSAAWTVDLVDDNGVTVSAADGKQLVVISESAAASTVGGTFASVAVPVIVAESYVLDAEWHQANVSNGPTEAANNLIKVVKRISAFGFTSFWNYRIRALLYAGKPNWSLLATITPTPP